MQQNGSIPFRFITRGDEALRIRGPTKNPWLLEAVRMHSELEVHTVEKRLIILITGWPLEVVGNIHFSLGLEAPIQIEISWLLEAVWSPLG